MGCGSVVVALLQLGSAWELPVPLLSPLPIKVGRRFSMLPLLFPSGSVPTLFVAKLRKHFSFGHLWSVNNLERNVWLSGGNVKENRHSRLRVMAIGIQLPRPEWRESIP